MEEFLNQLWPALTSLLPYFVSVITALSSFLVFVFYSRKQSEKEKALKEQLEQAKSRETYIKCPKCQSKLPLSEVNFYLPGDIRDNDLNGQPDSEQ